MAQLLGPKLMLNSSTRGVELVSRFGVEVSSQGAQKGGRVEALVHTPASRPERLHEAERARPSTKHDRGPLCLYSGRSSHFERFHGHGCRCWVQSERWLEHFWSALVSGWQEPHLPGREL